MKIFISWSGKDTISYKVANAIKDWLPSIIQSVDTWISSEILSGDRWNDQINMKLADSVLGIICVTLENKDAPWLNFEAGALAKGLTTNKVVPLLINLKPSDITGPLAQFQSKSLTKDDIYKIVCDINLMSEKPVEKDRIDKLFNRMWPDLLEQIDIFRKEEPVKTQKLAKRPQEDIIEELLSVTRDMRIDISTLSSTLGNFVSNPYNSRFNNNIRDYIESNVSLTNVASSKEVYNYLYELIKAGGTTLDIINNMKEKFSIPFDVCLEYLEKFALRSNQLPKDYYYFFKKTKKRELSNAAGTRTGIASKKAGADEVTIGIAEGAYGGKSE